MLKYCSDEDLKSLNRKRLVIVTNNVCNLSCGGCHQLCGLFQKEKEWFVSLDDFKIAVSCVIAWGEKNWRRFPEPNRVIGIYGGEPTIHPLWKEIKDIIRGEFGCYKFLVYTNGVSLGLKSKSTDAFRHHRDGITYIVSPKSASSVFIPSLIAPVDIHNGSKEYWWYKARKNCYIWSNCESAIYNGKAYFCVVAAAMDHMYYGGSNGWIIRERSNPMDRTMAEIDSQATNFCYRCGFCLSRRETESKFGVQEVSLKTKCTSTNYVSEAFLVGG